MTKFFGMMAVALMLLMSWSGVAAADDHDELLGVCHIKPGAIPQPGEIITKSEVTTEDQCDGPREWTSGKLTRCDITSSFIEKNDSIVFVVFDDGELVECPGVEDTPEAS